jgi:flavodoxin I
MIQSVGSTAIAIFISSIPFILNIHRNIMANKIGLFYGTQTGKTEEAAESIQKEFGGDLVVLNEICNASASDFDDYSCLIIGCPTWNIGELQSDWDGFYESEMDAMSFVGKKVAYFGTGDQVGYADNFQDAMGILEEKITSLGGQTVGMTSSDGYDHDASKAQKGSQFVGLALDEGNQPELSEARIKAWVAEVRSSFGI